MKKRQYVKLDIHNAFRLEETYSMLEKIKEAVASDEMTLPLEPEDIARYLPALREVMELIGGNAEYIRMREEELGE